MLLAVPNLGYAVLLNLALSTSLPVPVVITIKNGNLAASMLVGVVALNRRYTLHHYSAVALITFGLVLASLSGRDDGAGAGGAGWSHLFGVVCLMGALLSRAASSVAQEMVGQAYSVSVKELILYRSVLGLPFVLLQWRPMLRHIHRWNSEDAPFVIPTMWLLLLTNLAFDFGMKVSITSLISRTSALTATLALTCQRFLSFVFSAFLLSATPPSWDLWASAVAVLAGTILYMLPAQAYAAKTGAVDGKVKMQ